MSPERSLSGSSPAARAEAAEDILVLAGLGIDQITVRLDQDGLLAEEELEVALLESLDFRKSGIQPLTEDILAGIARDELQPVAGAGRRPGSAAARAASSSDGTTIDILSA